MIRACSTRFIFSPVSLSLDITCMETHYHGALLGSIPAFAQNLGGCQEGKLEPHPQDVQFLFLLLACVSLQSEAEHQRNADAPMAR